MKLKILFGIGSLLFFGFLLTGCISIDNVKENSLVINEIEFINIFPRTGTWRLTGTDTRNTYWEANIVIENVQNTGNINGYFDWYRTQTLTYRGREYFDGQFNNNTKKIFFKGTRLVNSTYLILGEYEAYLTEDGENFFNGSWGGGGGVPSNDWQAAWVDK